MTAEKKEPKPQESAQPMSLDEYKNQFGVVKESDLPEAERKPQPKPKAKPKKKGPPKMKKYEGKPMGISLKGLLKGIEVKKD